jgi:hypothetical protein
MVMGTKDGFAPVAIYARSAKNPLVETLSPDDNSWDILGTNLSKKMPDGKFTTETDRLRLMDTKDFNTLGLGLDDLIEAYVQTVLAVSAIDEMAKRLTTKGWFDSELYASLNRCVSFTLFLASSLSHVLISDFYVDIALSHMPHCPTLCSLLSINCYHLELCYALQLTDHTVLPCAATRPSCTRLLGCQQPPAPCKLR